MRRLAVIGYPVLALVAGCTGTASTGSKHPVSRASPASTRPAATPPVTVPPSSPSAAGSDCPATPVSGPEHTLTFPDPVGSYQIIDGPSGTQESPPFRAGVERSG